VKHEKLEKLNMLLRQEDPVRTKTTSAAAKNVTPAQQQAQPSSSSVASAVDSAADVPSRPNKATATSFPESPRPLRASVSAKVPQQQKYHQQQQQQQKQSTTPALSDTGGDTPFTENEETPMPTKKSANRRSLAPTTDR
jgi:hypothetical protein